MGRLTELHRYLTTPEKKLEHFYKQMAYLSLTEELKDLRKELGLYTDKD